MKARCVTIRGRDSRLVRAVNADLVGGVSRGHPAVNDVLAGGSGGEDEVVCSSRQTPTLTVSRWMIRNGCVGLTLSTSMLYMAKTTATATTTFTKRQPATQQDRQ